MQFTEPFRRLRGKKFQRGREKNEALLHCKADGIALARPFMLQLIVIVSNTRAAWLIAVAAHIATKQKC